MSDDCCGNHPKGCTGNGLLTWAFFAVIGFTLGWGWAALAGFITSELDWLIRVWKHKP